MAFPPSRSSEACRLGFHSVISPRWPSLSAALALLIMADPGLAGAYGWGFGAPDPYSHVHRRHHRQGVASESAPRVPLPQLDVPLPVPRPHFDDASPPTSAGAAPAPDVPDKSGQATAPLPPAKPPDLSPTVASPPGGEPARTKMPTIPGGAPSPSGAGAKPGIAPSGAKLGDAPGQPRDDATCPSRLKTRNVGVDVTAIGPQPDVRCTVVEAVRLSELTLPDGSKVAFPDRPTLACATADSFSLYVRDLLAPLAKGTYGATVAAVWTGPGLECRSRDHIFGAKLSAHGQGLAVDIAQLTLTDGRVIAVGAPKTEADQGFETAARAAACGYFHTVLGPGSDSYHRTHWHFDLEVRGAKGDSKFCQ